MVYIPVQYFLELQYIIGNSSESVLLFFHFYAKALMLTNHKLGNGFVFQVLINVMFVGGKKIAIVWDISHASQRSCTFIFFAEIKRKDKHLVQIL